MQQRRSVLAHPLAPLWHRVGSGFGLGGPELLATQVTRFLLGVVVRNPWTGRVQQM